MKEWFSGIVRGKTTDSRGKDKKVRHLFIVYAGERERLEDIENRGYAGKGNHSPQGEA